MSEENDKTLIEAFDSYYPDEEEMGDQAYFEDQYNKTWEDKPIDKRKDKLCYEKTISSRYLDEEELKKIMQE